MMAQDWAGWIVLEAIFSTIFVAEIVVKVAAPHRPSNC